MKIAILMSCASPWSRSAALKLIDLGHDVHVVDLKPKNNNDQYIRAADSFQERSIVEFKKKISGLHLVASPFNSNLRYVFGALSLKRIISDVGPDILLTLYGGGFALLALLCLFRPFVVYVVGSDVLLAKVLQRLLAKLALSKASIVLANGRFLAEKTREIAPGAHVKPLLLGIDLEHWGKMTPLSPAGPIRIICTRGFLPVYNNEYLIQGLACLDQSLPDYKVTFVSSGPHLGEVRALADRILPEKIRQRVEFLGGVSEQDLFTLLKQSHIYVSLSRSDGTSISLLEALSCGLFPILSDIPQNREWVAPEGTNGLLVPFDEPDKLAAALSRAILENPMRLAAKDTNRRLIDEHADSQKNMTELLAEMETLVNGCS